MIRPNKSLRSILLESESDSTDIRDRSCLNPILILPNPRLILPKSEIYLNRDITASESVSESVREREIGLARPQTWLDGPEGRTDKRQTDGRMDEQKISPFYKTSFPIWAAALCATKNKAVYMTASFAYSWAGAGAV